MNREFYQSLNEAYTSIYEKEDDSAIRQGTRGAGIGAYEGGKSLVGKAADAITGTYKAASRNFKDRIRSTSKGLSGDTIAKDAPLQDKIVNAGARGVRAVSPSIADTIKKTATDVAKGLGDTGKHIFKDLKKEDVQFMVGAYLLDSGLAVTPQDASAIVEHMADEYLEHMLDQIPEESFNELTEALGISDAALEAAAAATQKKHKEQGMKIHSTQGVKDLFKIGNKKGQV